MRVCSQVTPGDSIVREDYAFVSPGLKLMTVRYFFLLLVLLAAAPSGYATPSSIESPAATIGQGSALPNGEASATTATPETGLTEAEKFVTAALEDTQIAGPKRETGLLLTVYCLAIVGASMVGGWLPTLIDLTHTRMQTVISFVGGLMLGIAIFHLLPHSIHGAQTADDAAWWMMGGIVTMFLLIRCFHFHHHGPLEISTAVEDPCAGHRAHDQTHAHAHDRDGHHDHDHDHRDESGKFAAEPGQTAVAASSLLPQLPVLKMTPAPATVTQPHCHHAHELSWLGITLGLSLHTLIDGMALAASVQAQSAYRPLTTVFGLGTFLAIMLHKPLDAVSITSLMAGAGWSPRARFLVSLGFSAMCPLGVLIFKMGISFFGGYHDQVVCSSLAFSAGVFLCISLSDLLPEMEFHAHNRVRLTAVLLAGILLAYGITFLEPAHLH